MDRNRFTYVDKDENFSANIEYITCESGDWEILKVDDEYFFSGHNIPTHVWLDLLEGLSNVNIVVKRTELTDEEMENLF